MEASGALPRVLDQRFALDRLIGEGGMADVYRARDLRYGRTVAVKVLRQNVYETVGANRFLREIAVTAAFTHPHILALLDSGETIDADGRHTLYYVAPLIEGESLRDRLARETHLSLHDTVQLTREVLEALRYAHDHGVVHRDIKPANILLSDGHAVVADFGIARAITHDAPNGDSQPGLTSTGFAIGTVAYMSPEQAFADKTVDQRCDLYATGCMMYEMLVGAQPFDAPSEQAVIARKMSGIFVPPTSMRPSLPSALDEILTRALRPDPVDRYPSATAFLAALDTVPESTTPRVQPPVAAPALPARPAWRRPRVLGATLSIGGLLLGGGLATQWFLNRAATEHVAGSALSDPTRVAVLPFENLSADTSLAYVANGFTTDLIDELARVQALAVVSKNGVMPYRDKSIGTDSIARALKVGSIVTGDVRRNGDRISVAVRLLDGRTGQQLASHDTAGTMEDLLVVRSAVIEDVARFLRTRVGERVRLVNDRQRVRSPEAWELVERVRAMRAGELESAISMTRVERDRRFSYADSLLTRAAKLDPRWTQPVVVRAQLALDQGDLERIGSMTADGAKFGYDSSKRFWRNAILHANQALTRDSGDALALRVRGQAYTYLWQTSSDARSDSLRVRAVASLRAAVDRRPNLSPAWSDLSYLLQLSGDYAEAEQAATEAFRTDAFLLNAKNTLWDLHFTALSAEQTADAVKWCSRGRQLYPNAEEFLTCEFTTVGWTARMPADVGRAWRLLNDAERRDTAHVLQSGWVTNRLLVAAVAARAGLRDSAQAIVAATRRGMPSSGVSTTVADYGEAHVLALLGDSSRALDLLERYLQRRPAMRRGVARSPWFKALRTNLRFVAFTTTE